MIELTQEEWEEQFEPVMDDNDNYKDYHPSCVTEEERLVLKKAMSENRVWTLLEDEGLFITNRLRLINRLDVYITNKPYVKNEEYYIEM